MKSVEYFPYQSPQINKIFNEKLSVSKEKQTKTLELSLERELETMKLSTNAWWCLLLSLWLYVIKY